ncbi:MAG: amino acid permease [Nitrospirae bacterium]|nr:amino acid permease [Nitrospirota bacterium]
MTFARLLQKKSIDSLQEEALSADGKEVSLKRTLGPVELTAIGVGAIVGAGIFILTGHAAASYAGPAIVLSFLLAFVACGFAGLCYAELASMIPISGSAYVYAYAALGELIAWIIGWDLILEYFLGASTVAIGWSGYVVSFLSDIGIHIPKYLCGPPFTYDPAIHKWVVTGDTLNVPALFIITAMSLVLLAGIRFSSWVNALIVIIKVSILLIFIAAGAFFINPSYLSPFIPPNTGEFGSFGWSGILRGAGVGFFAYIGFDTVSTAASEARNPQRDLPIGILCSLIICTVLYMSVSLVLTSVVHYTDLQVPAPIAVAVDAMKLNFLSPFVKIGAIAGLSSVILVLLMGQSRIFYSMSRDLLIPKAFSKVNRRFKTPHVATIVTGVFGCVASSLLPIQIAGEMVSIGTLLAFVIVCAGVLILRFTQPQARRTFRAPGGIVVPIGGIVFCLYLMSGLPFDTWMRLIVWLIIGLVIYFTYSIKRTWRTALQ